MPESAHIAAYPRISQPHEVKSGLPPIPLAEPIQAPSEISADSLHTREVGGSKPPAPIGGSPGPARGHPASDISTSRTETPPSDEAPGVSPVRGLEAQGLFCPGASHCEPAC